jgi:signal transduction histidine kinase
MSSIEIKAPGPETDRSLREEELFSRLGWFIKLRWLAGAGIMAAIFVTHFVLEIRIPVAKAAGLGLVVLAYNVVFYFVLRWLRASAGAAVGAVHTFANVQIALDLVALTLLIRFTGGVENPLTFFYVFHMIISGILLSRANSFLMATFAAALVNGMGWGEYLRPESHYHLVKVLPEEIHANFLYVLLATGAVTITLYLATYMTTAIAGRLRQREEELEEANRALKALDQIRSDYLRQASHELRSPLSAIDSNLKIITQGYVGETNPKVKELLVRVEARIEELLNLVDDLLKYARLRRPAMKRETARVDLAALASEAAEFFRPQAEGRGQTFKVSIQPAEVVGVSDELDQLMRNLISNAIKYSPEGASVRFSLDTVGGSARAIVADTGIGIPAEDIEKVFEEFYRAPNAKKIAARGTGIGLPLAKKVAQLHGGNLILASELGKGTTFTVTLPLAPTDVAR